MRATPRELCANIERPKLAQTSLDHPRPGRAQTHRCQQHPLIPGRLGSSVEMAVKRLGSRTCPSRTGLCGPSSFHVIDAECLIQHHEEMQR